MTARVQVKTTRRASFMHAVGLNTFIIMRIMKPFWLFAGVVVILPHLPEEAWKSSGKAREDGEAPARTRVLSARG